jgi:hypothetical protein
MPAESGKVRVSTLGDAIIAASPVVELRRHRARQPA